MCAKSVSHESVFPNAAAATHMPFFDGKTLAFCQAGPPVEHEFACGGTIWQRLEANPALKARFAKLPRSKKVAFRRWKLHVADWAHRKPLPLATGLPAGAVECSPSFYLQDGIWHLSFIGGIPTSRTMQYRLYEMSGPSLNRLGPAIPAAAPLSRVGFVGRRYTCTGGGSVIRLHDRDNGTTHQFVCPLPRVRFVNYRADDEDHLIITGWTQERELRTLLHHVGTDETLSVRTPEDVYKPSLHGDHIVFAKRLGDGHENRQLWHGSATLEKAAKAVQRVAPGATIQSNPFN